ncbi:low molecular weight protein tyrosine phosphatase [Sporolactobacillus inulinus]|uniref:protein-tyrosine-phosphatase n=1 Tax=Sporolactobacillus inulinus TaxID=2078 RepID=A0A4Y1ZCW1_9BACL|nr:low molecular weight protein tyrosine phosphatase [Sporolactobacillus inulinus]
MRLLFVCLGNICRSPMAEAVMRAKIAAIGLDQKITVDSAGTGNWHVGEPPHQGTQRELKKRQSPTIRFVRGRSRPMIFKPLT